MSASSRPATGVAVLALPAILDVSWPIQASIGVLGSSDSPPTGALVLFALVGLVTLVAARPALRGHRVAAWVLVGSRVVSMLLIDAPAYVLGAPFWVLAVVSAAILLTGWGIWWTAPLLRQGDAGHGVTRATS